MKWTKVLQLLKVSLQKNYCSNQSIMKRLMEKISLKNVLGEMQCSTALIYNNAQNILNMQLTYPTVFSGISLIAIFFFVTRSMAE